MTNKVKVEIITKSKLYIPRKSTIGSAGSDIRAAIKSEIVLQPYKRVLVPSGIKIKLPDGYEAQIRPRSGLALNSGITILNTPGTIDNDYQGEIKILLINLGDTDFTIVPNMRICQIIISKYFIPDFDLKTSFRDKTLRESNGFGSTGEI